MSATSVVEKWGRPREALRCDARQWLAALDDLGDFYGRCERR